MPRSVVFVARCEVPGGCGVIGSGPGTFWSVTVRAKGTSVDAVLDMLLGGTGTPPPPPAPGVARLADLWLGGVPLARAAATVGVTEAEAKALLAHAGVRLQVASARAEEPERLRRLYVDQRLSTAQIAPLLGLSERGVRHRLAAAGITRPPQKAGTTVADVPARRVDQTAVVVRDYRRGRSIRQIAAELGVHYRSVWRILDEAGVERRPVGTAGRRLRKADLQRLYVKELLPIAEVARRLDVGANTVARNLARHGIERRGQRPVDRGELERLYVDQRLGIRAVAATLGVTRTVVRRSLAEHGIAVRRPGRPEGR